jgi:uncharacterized membrane protein
MPEFVVLLFTVLIFIIADLFWFSWSLDRIYRPTFAAIQGSPLELRLAGGIVAWLLLALGIRRFVVGGAHSVHSVSDIFTKGALFGLIVYGVYNGTNYATLKDYNVTTALTDMLWGAFVVVAVSVVSSSF